MGSSSPAGSDQRRLPPPRSVGGARRLRVCVRDPRHRGRRRADERGRLGGWSDVLVRALVVSTEGAGWLAPEGSGSRIATRPTPRAGRRAGRVPPRASGPGGRSRPSSRISSHSAARSRRTSAFGSVFKNPPGELGAGAARALRPQGSPHRRGDDLAEARQLHRERGRRDERGVRCPMVEARRRARASRRRARARGRPDRRPRGAFAHVEAPRQARIRSHGRGTIDGRPRRRTRAASAVVPFPRNGVGDRHELARLVPSGRSLLVLFALVAGLLAAVWGAHASSVFAVRAVQIEGRHLPVVREIEAVTAGTTGEEPARDRRPPHRGLRRALPSVAGASVDRAFPHTLVIKVSAEPVAVARRRTSSGS